MSPAGRRPGRSRSTTSARPTVCPNRLRTLCAVFIIVIGGFGYRLADLQLTPDQALAEPISRTLRTEDLPAQRGSIVDRLGRPLAYSRPAPTIVADPRLISTEQVPYVVGQLASFLDTDPEVMARRLTSDSRFVYLERQVDPEIGDAVMALGLPGVWSYEEPRASIPTATARASRSWDAPTSIISASRVWRRSTINPHRNTRHSCHRSQRRSERHHRRRTTGP